MKTQETTHILADNLLLALKIASVNRWKWEQENGYKDPSALVEGWRVCIKSIEEGTLPEIVWD